MTQRSAWHSGTMGLNSSSRASDTLPDDDSFSRSESEELRGLFVKAAPTSSAKGNDFEISKEYFCDVFNSRVVPEFGSSLYNLMKNHESPSLKYSSFHQSISLACKTTSSNCTKLLLEAFLLPSGVVAASTAVSNSSHNADGKSAQDGNTGNSGSETQGRGYDVLSFLRFCCEAGHGVSEEGDLALAADCEVQAAKIFRNLVAFTCRTKRMLPKSFDVSTLDFTAVNSWLNEYFPCVAQLLLTYRSASPCSTVSVKVMSSSNRRRERGREIGREVEREGGSRERKKMQSS